MFSWPTTPAYAVKSIVLWAAFLGSLVLSAFGRAAGWPLVILAGLALIPAITAIAQFTVVWRTISVQDEYVRALTAKRLMISAAITIILAVAWGPVQELLDLPKLPIWLIYPLFWGSFGVISLFIQESPP